MINSELPSSPVEAAKSQRRNVNATREDFVSPITGEQFAEYGNWKSNLLDQNQRGYVQSSYYYKTNSDVNTDINDDPILAKLKSQLAGRGAKGIIGLGRAFRIMDDDGSRTLSFAEFKKGIKEVGLSLSESELIVLFKRFG